jgi:hypothetical protein
MIGCAVAIRPDLIPGLSDRWPEALVIREFIVGDETLAESDL